MVRIQSEHGERSGVSPRGRRAFPIGAELLPEEGVHFRVWAPDASTVEVVLSQDMDGSKLRTTALAREQGGYHAAFLPGAKPGDYYWYRLDGEALHPDPASRRQPDGPLGPSQVVDPNAYSWSDDDWRGVALPGQVVYEMHIGTFTEEGTWRAAAEQLPELANFGVTLIEVMPVADFVGRFGWGYDGVNFFAPTRNYGPPDDFRAFVDRAHQVGLGVILDVVYNHFGPEGNFLPRFAQAYYSPRHRTEWGPAINFDGEHAGPVREYFLTNARYWIREFHLDGFRLDATQDIFDDSSPHIIAEIGRAAREAAGERSIVILGENEPQQAHRLKSPEQGGWGVDGFWNDDFHHSAMVRLSGRNEAYYSDHRGSAQEFVSAAKWGYLFQGQRYEWQKKRRGAPALDVPPWRFVNYLQNHDQVANSGRGQRMHRFSSPGRLKAMTALLLLMPTTPMLFQGQEFAASSPFLYFADISEAIARKVHEGRKKFMAQFPSVAQPEIQAMLPDPADPATFIRAKLKLAERYSHAEIYRLHRDLLRLRREDPVLRRQQHRGVDGAVLGADAFALRFFGDDGDDRLLLVNFEVDLPYSPAPEPLLAPPWQRSWKILWSSEDPCYGGVGTAPLESEENWRIPGHAAVLMIPRQACSEEAPSGLQATPCAEKKVATP